jgi:ATP-dependent helicase YprA (DUF1998 family)/Zn finger protein HypA/HybF involved in hydrogenase expression
LIAQRQELLDRAEVIHQVPYIESTPRYVSGTKFSDLKGLSPAALQAYTALATSSGELPAILYDPPYKHQSEAIAHTLIDGKNLLVMTGTGSGKTESFLLPILGKLAREAQQQPGSFRDELAVRALILYPMNALVNDQLGRLRSLFGDPRIVELFKKWAKRPPRFARYTSRTPYAGIRTAKRDQRKLKAFDDFYVEIQRLADGPSSDEQEQAKRLLGQLKARGKWPAKPDLVSWFGAKGAHWQDSKTGEFLRAVMLENDTELVTRHEVQAAPPDLLVTNYSMLEYMMMRPIERSIFDATREWLANNPTEQFLIVLDEAHLYRGAAGAEVGLLLRRLRDRLHIPPERFQVICATASFKDAKYAPHFGAQLSGTSANVFVPVVGTLDLKPNHAQGTKRDVDILSQVDLDKFYAATNDHDRFSAIKRFLEYRSIEAKGNVEEALYKALHDYPPLGRLINITMSKAYAVKELGKEIFQGTAPQIADVAVTVLLALGSMARVDPKAPGLLPCRIHNFFRGLPGLWVCMDPSCPEVPEERRSGICGKMYSQPRERCGCDARVHELFTCRFCGTAYARAYSDDPESPSALWAEAGQRLRMEEGETNPLLPLDLLLEEPRDESTVERVDYDLETGRINPNQLGPRTRPVYLRLDRVTPPQDEEGGMDTSAEMRGQFIPCACCGEMARFGRSTVQDHQTKGDQPFQALVARQIKIQPPGPVPATRFAPLQGRKVLVFSDSRQVAARLAPNLQMYSTRDSLRPLIAWGFRRLQKVAATSPLLSLDDLYLAVLLGSKKLGVRLRPELKSAESFAAEDAIEAAVEDHSADTDLGLQLLITMMRSETPPQALLEDIVKTVQDPFLGFEALALASLGERAQLTSALVKLPDVPGVAETPEAKIALARAWLRCWRRHGFWLARMPTTWWNRSKKEGVAITGKKGRGKFDAMDRIILDRASRKIFNDRWTPELLTLFASDMNGEWQLRGSQLSLVFEGNWVRCGTCKSVHRPVPGTMRCLDCESEDIHVLDPDADPVFQARKGYYRNPVMAALGDPPVQPMSIIAAEHTAQLNAPQNEDVFSKAEENELLFQDVAPVMGKKANRATAIDVLSSTTTMEVGIDIGQLSGVALRNMPPGRANYQQRAGRAGRRGNAVATVVAFGSADSHDEHYFVEPDGMIRGEVVDPRLTLDNKDITQRHIRAFLLQCYHQDSLPEIDPEQPHDLFSVLGTVAGFKSGTALLNRIDFERWLHKNTDSLRKRIAAWIPHELSPKYHAALLAEMKSDCLAHIDAAIEFTEEDKEIASKEAQDSAIDDEQPEEQSEEGEERSREDASSKNLLDRLLYRGVLPRYAFPTDVATFHVFDQARSSRFRPIMKFAPSQGLPIALSQYAPGKQIWISGKCYSSGAVYSKMSDERFKAWQDRKTYIECKECGYARTEDSGQVANGDIQDCVACGSHNTFGPARAWLRPPGFAHPIDVPEVTSPDDMPETSYATRAKLTMETPKESDEWVRVNEQVRVLRVRQHLLVSNTGPKRDGYSYCTKCGRIEAASDPAPTLFAPHNKPFPDEKEQACPGSATAQHIVLGTDFITDVALFSLRVAPPLRLKPGQYSTDVALRTASEALARAATDMLEIEPAELMAEYRPALTVQGQQGLEAEIFLYDTLPGGAGFTSQLVDRGAELFKRALDFMKSCPEQCDTSCYRCLRSFKNKFEHSLLDRHVGRELLGYCLTGQLPEFDLQRIKKSTLLLHHDLLRQASGDIQYALDVQLSVESKTFSVPILATRKDGRKYIIALSGPITVDHPADQFLVPLLDNKKSPPLILVNELLVRGNLPTATKFVQDRVRA